MSIDSKIEELNKKYAASKAAAAKAAQDRTDAAQEKTRRLVTLKTVGLELIQQIHDALSKRAIELSARIDNPANKLVVGYGDSSRTVFVSIGGRLLSNEVRFPCAYVKITDLLEDLLRGVARAPKMVREEPVIWRPQNSKIELLRNGQPQDVNSFVDDLIQDFLGVIGG